MSDHAHFPTRIITVLSAIIVLGTLYSVVYNTYLDTSNPLLTHLPHPLARSSYFASKKNILNVYFIKQAWGWTTAAFVSLWLTSPQIVRTKERVYQYLLLTGVWLTFCAWFFGPPLLDRLITATGGECYLYLPSGAVVSVPNDLCFSGTPVSPMTHPALFAASIALPDASWNARPRLRKGHDVSGHIFILTLSLLFLADQLRYSSMRLKIDRLVVSLPKSVEHQLSQVFSYVVILLSLFSVYTTSIYFHMPSEKFSGFLLGLAGYSLTQLSLVRPPKPTRQDVIANGLTAEAQS